MSRAPAIRTPLVVFSDQELGLWGVAVGGGDGQPGELWLASTGEGNTPPARAETNLEMDGELWRVTGPGHELTVAPRAAAAQNPDAGDELELCTVTGTVAIGESGPAAIDEAAHQVELNGSRCAALPSGKLGSVRLLSAWFPGEAAVTLLAARPHNASGQDKDRITVAALGESEGVKLFDPRLSTTYDGRGYPRRAGIEMWVGADEEGDLLPRRVAGALLDATPIEAATATDGPLENLRAHPLHCVSRGEAGTGVYLLLRA